MCVVIKEVVTAMIKKKKIEFRYYEMPSGQYVLPLLGKGGEQENAVGYDSMLHFHNYMEIGYCYHGDGRVQIEDRVYHYGDEMFSIIPASIPHMMMRTPGTAGKWEFIYVDVENFIRNEFHSDRITQEEIIKTINKRGTLKTRKNHPVMDQLILNIIRECRSQEMYYRESIKGYLYALMIEILRLDEEREQAKRSLKLSQYLGAAITYVDEHYMDEIKVADMANMCGLSESHFRRVFEESMGMKPVEYINLIRIKNACRLIQEKDISMEEVCKRVGYQTSSTFNRNFKRLINMTPYQWKAQTAKSDNKIANYRLSALKGWKY